MRRYDHNAKKWRDICEPALWPDQYIHHAVIQALKPVMMRGMDYWCCGSIPGRGTKRGIQGLKRWMNGNPKRVKYCAELDIRHFYDSLNQNVVLERMGQLIKDKKMMRVIESITSQGIMIGAYFSQWFANTALQPLDHMIREECGIKHYCRYMDNLTLFCGNKKQLRLVVVKILRWLEQHGLMLKGNWQIFMTDFRLKTKLKRSRKPDTYKYRHKPRLPNAMGYRFGYGFALIRKHTKRRTIRHLNNAYKTISDNKTISPKKAAGLLSRIGQFKHCNSYNILTTHLRHGFRKKLKKIISAETIRRNGVRKCLMNTCLEQLRQEIQKGVLFV